MTYSRQNRSKDQETSKNTQGKTNTAQFVDNRTAINVQQQQQEMMATSSQVIAQRALMNTMSAGSQQTLQRAAPEEELQMKAISTTAQLAEEEELLQGKFETAQRAEEEELLQGKFETAQRAEEEELLQGKFETAQRAEEEELLQGKFETAQRAEEEELLQGKFETAQRAEEEELLQGKFETTQRAEEEELLQGKFANPAENIQRKENTAANNTGLPDNLKSGIENMSGYSMDDVKVHYNSDKPAQMQAHAYAQGTNIHIAPGQEQHLPHEAWHVVQQKQGRVNPTTQAKGVAINDDVGLETEADVMGTKALQAKTIESAASENSQKMGTADVLQARFSQTEQTVQTEHFGGVRCQYAGPANEIEFHIDAGANDGGALMENFLIALWAARDTLVAGQARAAGHVIMHPGGVQVVKMTMEMLAEALGGGQSLKDARKAKVDRKKEGLDPSEGVADGLKNDVLGAPVIREHLAYRDALIGAQGVEMSPVGGGTMAGDTNMLDQNNDAIRASYDLAVGQVRHALSLNVRLDLAALRTVITSIENGLKWYQIAALKVKSWT